MAAQHFVTALLLLGHIVLVPSWGFAFVHLGIKQASIFRPCVAGCGDFVDHSKLFMTKNDTEEDTSTKSTTTKSRRQPLLSRLRKPQKEEDADNDPEEYWFNSKIHTLGNTGVSGALHAAVGAVSTKVIDKLSYKGRDVRGEVARELRNRLVDSEDEEGVDVGKRVLDMCCGVGMSTRALRDAFQEATGSASTIIGLDTSPEMVEMAQLLTVHESDMQRAREGNLKYFVQKSARRLKRKIIRAHESEVTFFCGNAEKTPFPEASFDLVTVMYSLHEVPEAGRQRIFEEARRLLKEGGIFAVLDISRDYTPSESMLAGEPYVLEYQKHIHQQLKNLDGFYDFSNETIVENHVELWQLTRDGTTTFSQ